MIPDEIVPQDIFHYTRMDIAFEKILFEKKLRFGQLGFTNDPRESKSWSIPKLVPNNERLPAERILAAKVLDEIIPNVMKEEWKVLCFTLENSVPSWVEDPIERVQYSSFNHGYAHPRMWAQYAGNHKGVCLWFDGNKINENINRELGQHCKIFRGKVEYNIMPGAFVMSPFPRTIFEDIDELGSTAAAQKYVLNYYEYFFLRKHPDWEAEAEYRWLIHSNKREPEFISIEGAIKGVLVGVDFPDIYKHSLIELCKDLKIPAGKITCQNGMLVASDLEGVYKP